MGLKQTIRKILNEESKVPVEVRRRISEVDFNVDYSIKEIKRQYGSICKLNETEFIETVIDKTIDEMYWVYFSDMDDNSQEWGATYRLLVHYIEDKFGDKLKKTYHINCGD